MSNGTSITWDQFRESVAKLPDVIRQDFIIRARQVINRQMMPMLHITRMHAYTGASSNLDNDYRHTFRLWNTIQLFPNTKNPDKAYVVLGEKTARSREDTQTAFYAKFVRGGHTAGRRHNNWQALARPYVQRGYSAKEGYRALKTESSSYVQGKDYFGKTDRQMGDAINESILNELDFILIDTIDKHL
jgi:hypothetical protein